MYASDYMYGASLEHWKKLGADSSSTNDYSSAINDNWLYMKLYEWTITRRSETNYATLFVDRLGRVSSDGVYEVYVTVRPVLYLKLDVKIIDGDGTPEKPYIISE